jgi:hypothetical protein
MKNYINPFQGLKLSPRMFTFNQLSKISDDNCEVLNQCIDMSGLNPEDVFVLTPIMIHEHAFGEEVEPHLRTLVSKFNDTDGFALQDITLEQWEQGSDNMKIAC